MKITVQIIIMAMLLLTSKVATAAMVDGGFVIVTNGGFSGSYNIFGNGFAGNGSIFAGGGGWYPFINCRSGCPSGTVSMTEGRVSGGDLEGSHYFHFNGPNVIITQGLVFADFWFDGIFCLSGPPNCKPLGMLPITGSGQVQIEVVVDSIFPDPNRVRVNSLTYTFNQTSNNQTPEPSFAPMIALGLLGLASAKHLRRLLW